MADLLVEQIMAKIVTLLTDLTTTGKNVSRERVYDIETAKMPFLTIKQGRDLPAGDQSVNTITSHTDTNLDIVITSHVKQNTTIETTLNLIRKEVHAAMLAAQDLGLSFVFLALSTGASEPELSQEEKQIGIMEIYFTIFYRHTYADASI